MAEFPAFPLFTDAYLGDTTHLTTIEHGAYLLLLMTAWRSKEGTLPDDDKMLSRFTKMTASQWKKIRPIMEPFFTINGGVWIQGRVMDERKAVRQLSENQKRRVKARWLKNKDSGHTVVSSGYKSGNTTPTPPIDINPSTVTEAKGGFKNKNGKGEEPPFDIRYELSDSDIIAARAAAPGWDIYHLQGIYNEGVAERGPPKHPGKAFIGWCGNYTKGKSP